MPELDMTLIVCGAPLATRTPDLVRELMNRGWRPTVIATSAAAGWLDGEAVTQLIGEPPVLNFRSPSEPKRGGPPAAVVVCPATFNTVNKAATGIMDTYPLGVLCEAIGMRTPTILIPMVSTKLWHHPAWESSLTRLTEAGVMLLDARTGQPGATPLTSGTGPEVARSFDPKWVTDQLEVILQRTDRPPCVKE